MFYGRQAQSGLVKTGDIRPMHVSSTNRPGLFGFRSHGRLSFRDRVLAFGSALVRSSMFGHDLIFQLEVLRDSSLERFSLSQSRQTDFVLRIRERGPLIKIKSVVFPVVPSTLVHRQLMKFVSKEVARVNSST